MNELDRLNLIMSRRDWFHLNDAMNIVYCPFDDRGNCHSEFHASTKSKVRNMVLNSSVSEKFMLSQRSLRKITLDGLRSEQISANVRGDGDEDTQLFNIWVNQSRQGWRDSSGEIKYSAL